MLLRARYPCKFGLGLGLQGAGFRGLGFGVQGLRVQGLRSRVEVWGSGFRVESLGLRVQGSGISVRRVGWRGGERMRTEGRRRQRNLCWGRTCFRGLDGADAE